MNVTALFNAVDYILQELNNKHKVMGIFFDMSRAFDTIDHDILLNKCVSIGIRGTSFNWLKSYLEDRKQRVAYKKDGKIYLSHSQEVKKGGGISSGPFTLSNIY